MPNRSLRQLATILGTMVIVTFAMLALTDSYKPNPAAQTRERLVTALPIAVAPENSRAGVKPDPYTLLIASIYVGTLLFALFSVLFFAKQKIRAVDTTRVQLLVTLALVESQDLEQAAERILAAIGQTYKFPFGAFWMVDEHDDVIRPLRLWQSPKWQKQVFYNATKTADCKRGVGLPGKVWQSGTASWLSLDRITTDDYPRLDAARESGLHGALGFPILQGSKVIGVVELCLPRLRADHHDLATLLSPLGQSIGMFVERIESRAMLIQDAYIANFASEVGRVFTRDEDLDVLMQHCAELPTSRLGAIFAACWILSDNQKCLELRGKSGDGSSLPDLSKLLLDDENRARLQECAGKFALAGQAVLQIAAKNGTGQPRRVPLLAQPLFVGQELVGLVAMILGRIPGEILSEKSLQALARVTDGIAIGISRRKMEKALKESDRLFSQITGNIEEMIWVTPASGFGTVWVNPSLARMFGRTQEQILHEPLIPLEAIHEDDREAAFAFFQKVSTQPSSIEFRLRGADKQLRWIWAKIYPTLDEDGQPAEIYGIATDITARKESEKQVHEFYSMVSHELRTPLTSVYASLRLMECGMAGSLPEKSQRLVEIARSECDRLIRLINDILDIRKIEAGLLQLKPRDVDVEKVVALSIEALRGMAEKARVTVISHCGWKGTITADQDRTIQMLSNLLSNAIKFSPPGGTVTVTVTAVEANDFVRFSVQDQGPGIADEQMSKLFGRFQQLDSSDSRPKGGSGLGLAITKAIVEQHGGKVGVESTVAEGSKFWLDLPLRTSPNHEYPITTKSRDYKRHLVLLIENDTNFAAELTSQLSPCGFEMIAAKTFAEADNLLKTSRPDAIIADADGYGREALNWIERHGAHEQGPNTVVLASEEIFSHHGKDTNTVHWHAKPMDIARLRMVLSFAVRELGRQEVTTLVLEAASPVRDLIVHQLQTIPTKVIQAEDGASAINQAQLYHPDLIILDPSTSQQPCGAEVIHQLRESDMATTPLLIYTPKELGDREKQDLTLGRTKFLTMCGNNEREFLEAVRELLDGLISEGLPGDNQALLYRSSSAPEAIAPSANNGAREA